jgi:HAD superfamily phosphoserine phosphatase-like hydrolase
MFTLSARELSKLLQPFEYTNEATVRERIESCIIAGSGMLHLVLDFDRTLTVGKNGADDATTWSVMKHHLPEAGRELYDKDFRYYRRLELDGRMAEADAQTWWERTLNLFVKHSVNLNTVEATFLDHVALRPGTKALLNICEEKSIPVVVLSAGVREVIQILFAQNNIKPPVIVSTELVVNDAGIVTGWRRETLVHVLNKKEAKHDELVRIRKERPYSILVGDGLDDSDMSPADSRVLRIRVIDQRPDEDTSSTMRQTFNKFDLAVTTGTLDGVVQLVKRL